MRVVRELTGATEEASRDDQAVAHSDIMREPKDEVAFLGSPLLGERVSDYYSAMLSRHLVQHGPILLLIGAMIACSGKSGEADPVEASAGHEKPRSSSGDTPDGEPLAALPKAGAPASKLPPPRLKTPNNTGSAREHSSPGVRVQPVQVARKTRPGSGSSEPEKPDSRKGKPKRWLGLSVANLEEPIEGAPETARAIVRRAHRGGPGYEAGLRRDDVILTADGVAVNRYQDYLAQAKLREAEGELTVSRALFAKLLPGRLLAMPYGAVLRAGWDGWRTYLTNSTARRRPGRLRIRPGPAPNGHRPRDR